MNGRSSQLTAAEWQVMECLWERSPRTGREAVDWLEKRVGWKRSTTLTLLRRLEDKGAVESVTEDGIKAFCPRIAREDAAMEEAENLLSRAYRGSVSLDGQRPDQKAKPFPSGDRRASCAAGRIGGGKA